MLEQYQQAFYDMAVNRKSDELIQYTGGLMSWQTSVYQNNYRQGLKGCLYKKYKKVVMACDQAIETIFNRYIESHPSIYANLRFYGEDFPSWIGHQDQKELPQYLSDLSRLDWLLYDCYYERNADDVDLESFARLTETQQVSFGFTRKPSVNIMQSKWNLNEIVKTLSDHQKVQPSFERSHSTHYYCIYREEGIPKWKEVSNSLYRLLDSLKSEQSLNDLECMNKDSNGGFNLEEDFSTVLKLGWLTHDYNCKLLSK